jgi:hypothetical protein
MRATFIAAIAAAFAVAIFAAPKPAQAVPASTALAYGDTDAGMVQRVHKKYRYGRKWRRGPYYAHRHYWGPYAYYGPRYSYWGYPYYYRRGPGVSLWFGF